MSLSATQAAFITVGISLLTVGVVTLTSPLLVTLAAGSTAAAVGVVALDILGGIALLSTIAAALVLKYISLEEDRKGITLTATEFFRVFPIAFIVSTVFLAAVIGITFLTGGGASSAALVVVV